ncbi:transforming growth factor-beta-induced protein ig-h3 [Daphnia magna]|uniref:Transforming growth factor-beta-induced protein Ig-H3 n=1 Tax=Daphnia magna TaxID=35525 RepID=A0A164PEK3_9CRUS|nr:transforming growth factor-beta-induced protein ig-h3 [Daphnia magna]KZS06760.1 Transforming growth factor-beta-induced protein Ig-H3 [Daphnia magna]
MKAYSLLIVVLVCCASWSTVDAVNKSKLPAWHIRFARQQGPNACVVEEVPGTKWKIWTECKYYLPRKICGQKTVLRFECCEGFHRVPGQDGCAGVKPLKNILETARELGATDFVRYVEESGLQKEWAREGAFTLFAPTNEAFANIPRELRARVDSFRGNIENPILRYHVSDRKVTSDTFQADLTIPTLYNGNRLRINKYSSGMLTVNCRTIVRKDQEATNGVVHMIDSLLDPGAVMSRDVSEIVSSDGRFSVLAKAMEESAFFNKLRAAGNAAITILAPSDEAFQKIPASRLDAILKDKEARLALLQNHVLVHPLCAPAIIDDHSMRTFAGNRLRLECDAQGVSVEGSRLRNDFVLGSNGLVHMMDDVLLPNRAKNLLELAESERLTTFMELVKIGGVEEAFSKFGAYTIFIPSEAAFYSLPEEVLQDMRSSQEKAQAAILYHATQGRLLTNKIKDSEIVMSLDEENPLRLSVYRKAIGVECAVVEKADMEGQNGVIHIINRVMIPANISAGDLLRREGNFKTFLQAMELVMTGSDALDLSAGGISSTFFVPTDAAFEELGATVIEDALKNRSFLKTIVANHVVPGLFNSDSFKTNLIYKLPSMLGTLDVRRIENILKVREASVIKTDLMNTNGVIHVIDKVLMPEMDEPAEPLVQIRGDGANF